ncbi:putative enzyme related to lactoylglutathione lyase [Naumannella cuiyingiana]|uniref:Putative enzyme related to lactoylglutathione lyase n=1 Tax=Naumannella cuiyingiana TaxID=1347891 RepID=A0A7Z0DCA5_9ACTN|nr:putative enzyme related to lactoylglutathione lyase [Naumannella cuiyingiana]
MARTRLAVIIDANDPALLARFWAALLRRDLISDAARLTLPARDDRELAIRFEPTARAKRVPNWAHFDLTSTSLDDQKQTVTRALGLGATLIDFGQGPDAVHDVLADPEGNEFCVTPHWNTFLARTDRIGALACDGTRAVGEFWAAALGWPLVWDEGEETAIQSPAGGTKISWGGPPLMERDGRNRWRYELITETSVRDEVDQLTALGAALVSPTDDRADSTAMSDPDGNEFTVAAPRSWTSERRPRPV